ncbi:MAG: SusC/RagA family TonB-linked outer membrane protein [Ilyomonas sp.]
MPSKTNKLATSLLLVLLCIFCSSAFAQRVVTGKVTNKTDNSPIAGASVQVKGTTIGTQTDAEGNFSINVPNANSTLVVSYVGFMPIERAAGTSSSMDFALSQTSSEINEVVVTGYTAQRKKEITGAVSVVNVNQMKQQPAGSGEEALQGHASGVTIITSGQPGAASDIRIRGITSFGDNSPLIIVDGVRGDLHNLNVNDIESVQVLKDASAAIYGVAGSNGVIIVTTKKGRSGQAKVSYDGYYGVTTRGPGYDMANTQEEANAIWLQQRNSGIANPSSKQYGSGANPVIPDYITPAGAFEGDPGTDPSTYDINSHQITKANKIGTNWYKEITRNAPTQSHNISVSSGSEKSSYFFSLNYLNQQGIARFQYLKRYSARINTQFNIKNNIRVGENAYIFYKQNPTYGNQGEGSPFSMAFREDAIIPVYDIMGNFAGTKSQDLGNAQNVYANLYRTKDNKGNTWDITGNIYAEIDFLKHFTARSSFGGIIDNQYGYAFGYVGYENAEGNTGANSFSENARFYTQWTFNNTLTYNNIFGDHSVKVLIGTEAVSSFGRFMGAGRSNYFSENPNFWTLNTGTGAQSNSGSAYQSSIWSQFARLDYGYKSKYLINASIRRDGSSLFTDSVRYGYFPAVSAAWRISQEDFFKSISFINELKLRYSWGKMGSTSNVSSTNPFNLYGSRSGKSFYDISGTSTSPVAGFYRSNIGNPTTTWEGDIISNVGLDATILNNKIDFTIDWYKKKVSGLLFTASGLQYDRVFTGDADLPKVNIGDMQNTGIDLSVTYHGSIAKDFKFDLTGTFTSYNNKIVSVPGLPYFDGPSIRNVIITRNQEGHPVGAFFGYQVLGIFQSDEEVAKAPKQTGAEPGVFRYKDVDGDGEITPADRTYIGDPNPDFTYGLNIAFTYKNFDFSSFFFGSKGNDIFNQTLYYTDFPDFFKGAIRREAALNSWTPNNPTATIPKLLTTGNFSTDLVTNSYFINKGSYFRCRQMQLGYTFPSNALQKLRIDRLRIYIQAANLFTITKYNGLDPELQSQSSNNGQTINSTYLFGIDQGNYPHTPAYLFGVNLNF